VAEFKQPFLQLQEKFSIFMLEERVQVLHRIVQTLHLLDGMVAEKEALEMEVVIGALAVAVLPIYEHRWAP
jgi:hypothetical protein